LKVRRGGAGLHPRWGDFTALEGSKWWRNRLGRRGSPRRGGTPLALGLELGGDLLGRGLLGHGALGRGTFGGCALVRGAFCGRSFIGGGTLRRRTLGGALSRGALRERPLSFRAPRGGLPLGFGTFLGGTLRGGLLGGGAELLLGAPLHGRLTLLDRALHRDALFVGTPGFLGDARLRRAPVFLGSAFVLRAAFRSSALVCGATFLGRALFVRPTLGGCLLGGGALCGGTLGGRALFRRPLFFVSAPLRGRKSLLDRALERRVLSGGALLLFRAPVLRDAPLFSGALGRGTILGRVSLLKLARLGRGSALSCRAFGGGTLFCGAYFGRKTLTRRALRGGHLLRGTTLFVSAPLLGRATILRGTLFRGAQLRGDTLFFSASRLLCRTPLFGALLGGMTLFFDALRFLGDALLLGEALLFGNALRSLTLIIQASLFVRDALLLSRALGRDAFFCRAPRRGLVDGGEDLLVFDDREGLLILDLVRFGDRGPFVLERLLRHRSLFDRRRGRDRLVHRRPRLFDARCGARRGARDRWHRRAPVFDDELFEQTAQRIGRSGAQIGWTCIGRDRPTQRRDRAAALVRDVVLKLIVILAQALDLFQEHAALFAGLLEDLRRRRLGALPDLVRGAKRARERLLSSGVVLLVNAHPALGGLKIGLELRDFLGELRHPQRQGGDDVVRAIHAAFGQRGPPFFLASPRVRPQRTQFRGGEEGQEEGPGGSGRSRGSDRCTTRAAADARSTREKG